MKSRKRYLQRKAEAMHNGNGRVNVPVNVPLIGQQQAAQRAVSPGHIAYPGPTAAPVMFPHVMTAQGGQPVVITFGGFNRLEEAALRIAAGMMANAAQFKDIPAKAVEVAKAVLDACAEAQAAAQQFAKQEAAQEQPQEPTPETTA